MFAEMLKGYMRSEAHTHRIRYYEKRKLTAQISKVEDVIKTISQQDCIVPDTLLTTHQEMVDKAHAGLVHVSD